MNSDQDTRARNRAHIPCSLPEVGDLLPDFIVGLLSAEATREFNAHLEVCDRCAGDYDHVMRLRTTARKLFIAAAGGVGAMPGDAPSVVRHISDYKK